MKNKSDHSRLISFDFIRCFATFCIITFHFVINGNHIYPEKYVFGNYDLAQVGVSLFFILSGASLYYNYKENFSIKKYYKKRFLAIFPYFYVAYCSIFLFHFWESGNILKDIPLKNLFFSFIGMDGLLSYKIPCLSLTGEWFLGAILILYLIYPFLRFCVRRNAKLTLLIITILYIVLYFNYTFQMPLLYNPLIRSVEFVFGMVFIEKANKDLNKISNLKIFIFSILTIILLYIKLPIPQMFEITLGGCTLFIAMFEIGKLIKNKNIINVLKIISKYSFVIFLVHHYIANIIQNHFINYNLNKIEKISSYIIYLLLITFFAKLLLITTNKILYYTNILWKNRKKTL